MQKDLSVVLFTVLMHSEAGAQWLPNVKLTNHPLTLAITRVPSLPGFELSFVVTLTLLKRNVMAV